MAENLELLTSCPVCSGNTFTPFIACTDYTVSRGTFQIVSCETCGFVATSPRPTEAEAYKYYQSENYISHSNTRKGLINKVYAAVRNYSIKKKESLLREFLRQTELVEGDARFDKLNVTPKLLDHGCGTGEFLNYCKQNGWDATGLEPGDDARNLAIANYNLPVIKETEIVSLPEKSFDAITLWHVLEHVYPLNERVAKLKTLLKDDGVLIVAVPNHNTAEEEAYKENWAAYDVPRHIWHFDQKSMKAVMKNNGLQVVDIRPMVFDAYYISMVSEGYNGKQGIGAMLNGFLSGLKSNNSAKKTGEYSSLIYIIKKV